MNKKLILFSIAGIIIITAGIFGISGQDTLTAGNCETKYKKYYLEPFICTSLPCEMSQEMITNNAKVDVIQCLCNNRDANEDIILQFYSEKDASTAKEQELDVNDICNNFRKTYPR